MGHRLDDGTARCSAGVVRLPHGREEVFVPASVVGLLASLILTSALLVGATTAASALDRCMTPLEEQVWLLVNQRRAEGAFCGGEFHPPADALEAADAAERRQGP